MSLSFLFICAQPPTYETGCGSRTLAAIRFLVAAGHSVDLWSPKADGDAIGDGYRIAKSSKTLKASYDVAWSMDNWYHKHIAWAASAVEYAKQNLGVKIAIDGTGDYIAKTKLHLAKSQPDNYAATVRAERELWNAVDLVLAVSSGVADDIATAPQGPTPDNVLLLPLAQDNHFAISRFEMANKDWAICLPGSLHGRNKQAFIWFINRVWPLVHTAKPKLSLRIFGGGTRALKTLCDKQANIELAGRITNFSQGLSRCLLSIVPATAPGGLKTVILESLMAGTPVISAQFSNERMGLNNGPSLMSASSAEDYAKQITRFTSNCHLNEKKIEDHITTSLLQFNLNYNFSKCMERIVSRIGQH